MHLNWFSHQDDNTCWWYGDGVTTVHRWKHLFHQCRRWKDQQKKRWKAVRMAIDWRAGRYRHMQNSELFSMGKCDKAVLDFLVITADGKFPPRVEE
jgi:hypothetical protein